VLPPSPDEGRVIAGTTPREHPSVRRRDGPKWNWDDAELVDRYESSFDLYIVGGTRHRRPDGSVARATMFWSAVKRRAQELIPHRPVRTGIDLRADGSRSLQVAIRAGSPGSFGHVFFPLSRKTLELSSANVIVVLGRWARLAMKRQIGLRSESVVVGPIEIGERERWVAFLPHPNARAVRSFPALCTAEELRWLQEAARG
jgi:hypothetical protein